MTVRPPLRSRRAGTLATAVVMVGAVSVAGAGSAQALASPRVARVMAKDTPDNRMPGYGHTVASAGKRRVTGVIATTAVPAPALFLSLGPTPSASDLPFIASHYTVAILNPYDISTLKSLKQLNPRLTVLCYQDFASMRSDAVTSTGADQAHGSSPIGWNEAQAHGEAWFAHSTSTGKRIEWSNFANQYQAAVWNKDYQTQWVTNVANEVVTNGWDGVMVDNYMSTLWYYYNYDQKGATEMGGAETTDAAIRRAELDVTMGAPSTTDTVKDSNGKVVKDANGNVVYANYGTLDGTRNGPKAIGPRLKQAGKLYIPSVSDGRQDLSRWAALTQFGGGLEENWTHWDATGDTNVNGYFYDWDGPGSTSPSGFRAQQKQTPANGGLFLTITTARPQDNAAATFGLASFWVASGGQGAFTALTRDAYTGVHLRPEQEWNLGAPTGPAQEGGRTATEAGSVFYRTFAQGFAAVNPSRDTTQTIVVPPGFVDAQGISVSGSYTLPPVTGLVLHRP